MSEGKDPQGNAQENAQEYPRDNPENSRNGPQENAPEELTPPQYPEELTPLQYNVCFNKGTERAFTGEYWDCHDPGTYRCRVCRAALFPSDTKYDSGSGWPSFWAPIDPARLKTERDTSYGMVRTEVMCACGAHLGHLFDDGPQPTGLRFCINSASLVLDRD